MLCQAITVLFSSSVRLSDMLYVVSGLKDVLRELPSREASRFRTQVSPFHYLSEGVNTSSNIPVCD